MFYRYEVPVLHTVKKSVSLVARSEDEAIDLARRAIEGEKIPSCFISDLTSDEVIEVCCDEVKRNSQPCLNIHEEMFSEIYDNGKYMEEAEFCISYNYTQIEFHKWVHIEKIAGVKMTHGEFKEIMRRLDADALSLDKDDAVDILRNLIHLRSTDM